MSSIKALSKYGLEFESVVKVDLRTCYVQARPNCSLPLIFNDNMLMVHSPHYEIALLYYQNGVKWLKKNYKTTRYYNMMRLFGKRGFPEKVVIICDSIKDGYLREGFVQDYIVMLTRPFAITRYERDIEELVPEVWSGHHRVGALLALKRNVVDILVATDVHKGSKKTNGKIHQACIEMS